MLAAKGAKSCLRWCCACPDADKIAKSWQCSPTRLISTRSCACICSLRASEAACDDGALGMRACGSLSAALGCAGARRGAGGGKIGWLRDCAGLLEEMCGMLLGLGFAESTGAPPSCDAGGLSAARLLKTGGGLPGWWEGYFD